MSQTKGDHELSTFRDELNQPKLLVHVLRPLSERRRRTEKKRQFVIKLSLNLLGVEIEVVECIVAKVRIKITTNQHATPWIYTPFRNPINDKSEMSESSGEFQLKQTL